MKKRPFDIPTLDASLKRDYECGHIDARTVAVELYKAGWYFWIPEEKEALRRIGAEGGNKDD